MVIWGIVWGAILGSYLYGFGVWLGAVAGFFAGLSLRWVIRREIIKSTKKSETQTLTQASHEMRGSNTVASNNSDLRVTPKNQAATAANITTSTSTSTSTSSIADSFESMVSRPKSPLLTQDVEQAAPQLQRVMSYPFSMSAADNEAALNDERIDHSPQSYQPTEPSAFEMACTQAKNWLVGGNTVVRVGLVILFIGLSFLATFAAAAGLIPVELRLGAIGAAAIALLVVGFQKRDAKPALAVAFQGTGVAVMYLTVFAAFRLYDLLMPLPAFALMIVVCALSCALALLQNSRALAVAAFAGGFAVPLLLSTGNGSHVGLFSYYTMLNLAILFIAYKRSWRVLNVVGFIATFGVAGAWGARAYLPEQYASTQPFLICFVLIYLLAAILYARNTPTKLGNSVDSMLVFGTPLIGFGLQAGLVQAFEFGTAFSALGFAVLYLGAATLLARRALENYRVLIECLIAIGIGFVTLTVPLALDARWTSAVWALEGAGAFWVGMRQARWMPRAFGLLMQVVAAWVFVNSVGANISAWPFVNPVFMGAMFIALPALGIAWWLRKPLPHSESTWAKAYAEVESNLSNWVYLCGFAFWCAAWALEISRRVPSAQVELLAVGVFNESTTQLLTMLALLASAGFSMSLGWRKNWAVATWPSRLSVLVMALTFVMQTEGGYRVFATPGWIIWPVVLMLHYWMLRRNDTGAAALVGLSTTTYRATHVASAWLVTLLLADGLWFWIGKGDLWSTSWAGVVLLISAIAVLLVLAGWAGRANQQSSLATFKWPLNQHAAAYYWVTALPLVALIFGGALLVAVHSSGQTDPLPYIPLLNPTDLTIALAVCALLFWRRVVVLADPAPAFSDAVRGKNALAALVVLAFIGINTVWLRIAHHFFGVAWEAEALFSSFVVQTGYAILWTLLALILMVFAQRQLQRPVWLVGAGLLGMVVLKLFVVDLSNTGGAGRIIAFIVVGVLMLVVGYIAPFPPKTDDKPMLDTAPDFDLKSKPPGTSTSTAAAKI